MTALPGTSKEELKVLLEFQYIERLVKIHDNVIMPLRAQVLEPPYLWCRHRFFWSG